METPKTETNERIDNDAFAAFIHGIRLALAVYNHPFDDTETLQRLVNRADAILHSGKHSLIGATDGMSQEDWALFRDLREFESQLCSVFLQKVIEKYGDATNG